MKIKLAPHLQINVYFCLGLSIAYYLFLVYVFFDVGMAVLMKRAVIVVFALLFGMLPVANWLPHMDRMATIWINQYSIRSYLFGRMQCEVRTDGYVYYAIFDSDMFQGVRCRGRYIIISNEPFSNVQSLTVKRAKYDQSRQIVLPYNEKTMPLLPVENWQAL